MTNSQATLEQDTANEGQTLQTYLLSIRGVLAPATLEEAREIHNSTAGAPQSVAAAQSLGDLSHMVHVPAGGPGADPGEFLILDVWNSIEGLGQFFANPHVQEQAGQIFASRDPVVWMPAEGFSTYHLAAPYGKNDRFVAIVRGTVRSHEEARAVHNAIVGSETNKSRRAGSLSHDVYFRMAAPGSPEALEFFAVDVWMDAALMAQRFQDPGFLAKLQDLFVSPPSTSAWVHPAGEWVEW